VTEEEGADRTRTTSSEIHPVTVGFLGAFSERKGFRFFLELAVELCQNPSIRCYAVGGTEQGVRYWRESLPEEVRGRIRLEPFQHNTDSFFREVDIFCMTSFQEPFARVNLEAASHGLAVVASAVDGNAELFEDSNNARLCRPGDLACFKEKILRLVENPEQRKALGQRARETVRRGFTTEQCHAKVLGILQEELGGC
jgi:glycosyltransferase involved in cell wall biosynthesis